MTLLASAQQASHLSATMTAGAIDTHAHIFEQDLPMAPDRRYTPAYDAPLRQYLQMLDEHGVAKGVLVQPSFLGTDNSYLLRALRSAPHRLRGVVVVNPSTPGDVLKAMQADGVVGIRLNLIGRRMPFFGTKPWIDLFDDIASLNWLIEIQCPASALAGALPPLLSVGVPVVVDHFGLVGEDLSRRSGVINALTAGSGSRRLWVKISAPYRLARNEAGEELALRAFPEIREALGVDRLVWGSDWPHTQFEDTQSYFRACSSLLKIVPNESERRQILQTNALSLFCFTKRREPIENVGG